MLRFIRYICNLLNDTCGLNQANGYVAYQPLFASIDAKDLAALYATVYN